MAKKTITEKLHHGIGVSPGVAIGPAHVVEAGFIEEGVSRRRILIDGNFYDDIRMAIVRE